MINENLMNQKINLGQAKIIKKHERQGNKKWIKTVEYQSNIYKLCPYCLYYKKLNGFTKNISICKPCRNEESKKRYREDIDFHMRFRWHAICRQSKKQKCCTFDEFKDFFHNEKCQYTGRTLAEDFHQPHHNKLLRLEVDHMIPISEGGTTYTDNLHVIPACINNAKKNANHKDWKEAEDFLFGGNKI